ncbi:MAG: threonine ammonia-lyase, biosynthetic [Pseudomonadota bacterium]
MSHQAATLASIATTDWRTLTEQALTRVYQVAKQTPVTEATSLGSKLGARVLLKREDLQPVFSFKLRGAYNKIAALGRDDIGNGVVCSSAGNHAQGVAMAAGMRGVHAVIVMPVTTPAIKVDAVRAYGSEIILHGDTYDAAQQHAMALAEDRSLAVIHPFDDPLVIAGQSTIGVEIDTQVADDIDYLFIPIGGGGLAAGIASVIKRQRPNTRIIGVEPDQSASMRQALATGGPVTLERVGIFADGVAVRRVGDLTFALCQQWLDDIVTVNTDQTCAAIRDIYEETRTVVEPAGALAVAGMKQYASINDIQGKTLVGINCGANLNFDRLRHIAERAAFGEQREALFAVRIEETPGSFRRFCAALGQQSVTEFNYRLDDSREARIFVGVALQDGADQRQMLLTRIADAGYAVDDMSDNELAKLHVRHLVGGRSEGLGNERLYRFEFPERPGALMDFLNAVGEQWNISLFHYRNHGSDFGRVLAGIQVDAHQRDELDSHLAGLHFDYWDETDNPAYRLFLT